MSFTIPFEDFGGKGEVIHFAHANGFPPATYGQLMNELTPHYHVIAMKARPLWPHSDHTQFRTWRQGADDLIAFLDQQNLKNIIGIGHSFGAVCSVMAANKRPDLFRKLILIEPVVLPKWYYVLSLLPQFVVKKYHPLVRKTLERTDKWNDRQLVFENLRSKNVFSEIGDEALWDYVNAATSEAENGRVFLNYSKEWEAQIFLSVVDPWKELKQLKVPFLAVRGQSSDTIFPSVWKKWKSINQTGKMIEMADSGHLVPLEKPAELASEILAYLEGTNVSNK